MVRHMNVHDLHSLLCSAIATRCLVVFEYGDLFRVVEPHRVGINGSGHAILTGWLRAGYSRADPAGGWRHYLLRDIQELELVDAPFVGGRPGYIKSDPRMREIFYELTSSTAQTNEAAA